MNLQIHDILSNPDLLKDVSEDTLNSWTKQYPYVPIFHLYSLKRKQNYTETDLHKTAFYINNREKLYFLLKQDSKQDYKIKSADIPDYQNEISTDVLPKENNIVINEIVTENNAAGIIESPEIPITVSDEKGIIKDETIIKDHVLDNENKTEQISVTPDETVIKETEILKPENTTEENEIISVNKSEAIIEKQQILENTVAHETKPLSIADQILAEIKLLKEERAKTLQATEQKTENISAEKTTETISQEILNTDKPEIENITKTEAELTITEDKINPETEIPESDSVLMPQEKEELTEHTEASAETVVNNPSPEKSTSIQDEIIARLKQIKAERETKANSEPELDIEQVNISRTDDPVEEIIETDTSEYIPEKTLSIQDEIIARIQKIKEEREAKEKSENVLLKENVIPVKTEVTTEIPEPIEEIIEIDTPEETPLSSESYSTSDIETEKEELQSNLKSEEKHIEVPFGEAYKQPLLVHIEPSASEKKVFTDLVYETQKEDKTNQTDAKIPETTFQTIKEEKEIPEIILDKALISEKPVTEKEILEEIIETDLIQPQLSKLDDEIIKEPHTFVEWLKLLDGNLQIQTTETPTEKEWIEIPQYEVMQTIANKKQIQEEEAKIFEPNFEEGEIDLFNEIDEEVTKSATESVSFKQDMMTETLAKIYTKQGKTDKALEIYNALLLKFPEKSSYFATLIQNLQK